MLFIRSLQPLPLPPLPLISTEVIDIKGSVRLTIIVQRSLQVDQSFAASMDGEAT
jgi:hypothetical protein